MKKRNGLFKKIGAVVAAAAFTLVSIPSIGMLKPMKAEAEETAIEWNKTYGTTLSNGAAVTYYYSTIDSTGDGTADAVQINKIYVTNNTEVDGKYPELDIPSSIGGLPVTELGASMKYNWALSFGTWEQVDDSKLTDSSYWTLFGDSGSFDTVTIPSTVTKISSHAFVGATFTNLVINSDIKYVPLKSGIMGGTGAQRQGMFQSGKNIIINEGVTEISDYFYNGYQETGNPISVSFPNSLRKIGFNAFFTHNRYILHINDLTIPSGVTEISAGAFDRVIPDNLHYNAANATVVSVDEEDYKYNWEGSDSETVPTERTYAINAVEIVDNTSDYDLIDLQSTVESFPSHFLYGGHFKNATFPSSIKTIKTETFCRTTFNDLTVPSTVTKVNENAFVGCKFYNLDYRPSDFGDTERAVVPISDDTSERCTLSGTLSLHDNVSGGKALQDYTKQYSDITVTSLCTDDNGTNHMVNGVCEICGKGKSAHTGEAYISAMTNEGGVNVSSIGKHGTLWHPTMTLYSDTTQSFDAFCIDLGKHAKTGNEFWSSGEYTENETVSKIVSAYKMGMLSFKEAQVLIWCAIDGKTSEDDLKSALNDIGSPKESVVSMILSLPADTIYLWTNIYGTTKYQRFVSYLPPSTTDEPDGYPIEVPADEDVWYHITYNANGATSGTAPTDAADYQADEYALVLGNTGNLEKTGKTFGGWAENADGTGTAYNAGDFCHFGSSDVTLYAKWDDAPVVTHTVTFDADGGTPEPNAQTVNDGDAATEPTAPTKEGFTFVSWQKDGSDYNFSSPVTDDIELKAKYKANVYTVTFDADGGTPTPDSQTVEYDGTATKPADPEKEGFTFAGWFNKATDALYDFTLKVRENLNLIAHWGEKTFKVTFDTDGGSEVAEQTIVYGKTAYKPADPTKTGFTFGKWQKDGVDYDFSTPVTADITLKATWTADTPAPGPGGGGDTPVPTEKTKYTVTYVDGQGKTLHTEEVEEGSATPTIADPTKEGYIFKGWSPAVAKKVTGNATYVAQWEAKPAEKKQFTVTYTDGQGTTLKTVKVDEGEATPSCTAPTREGYTFTGWSPAVASTVTADVTYVAQWKQNGGGGGGGDTPAPTPAPDPTPTSTPEPDPKPEEKKKYTVTYTDGLGSTLLSTLVEEGSVTPGCATPTREGYEFQGWTPSVNPTVTGDATYTATWDAKQFTVTYTDGQGNVLMEVKVDAGSATPSCSAPTRDGYSFSGWSPYVAPTVTGDATYVAEWGETKTEPTPTPTPAPTPTPKPNPTPEPPAPGPGTTPDAPAVTPGDAPDDTPAEPDAPQDADNKDNSDTSNDKDDSDKPDTMPDDTGDSTDTSNDDTDDEDKPSILSTPVARNIAAGVATGAIVIVLAVTGAFKYLWTLLLLLLFRNRKIKFHGALTEDDNKHIVIDGADDGDYLLIQKIIDDAMTPDEILNTAIATGVVTNLPYGTKMVFSYSDDGKVKTHSLPADETKMYDMLSEMKGVVDVTLVNDAAKIDIPMHFNL